MTSLPPKRWGFSKAPDGERLAGPQVEHLQDHGRRAHVEGDPEETIARRVHVLVVPAALGRHGS